MSLPVEIPTAAPPEPDLRGRWRALQDAEPRLRIADAARRLGVSEAELLCLGCGEDVTRLDVSPQDLLRDLEGVGEVMALTRNASAVIERDGRFRNLELGESVGLVLDEGLDLRLFFSHWRHTFAVESVARGHALRSIQVFDATGRAVMKIYHREGTDTAAWDRILAARRSPDQRPLFIPEPARPAEATRAPGDVDVAAFQAEWRGLTDTHQFHGLLRRHRLSRVDALRLAPDGMARRVDPGRVAPLLKGAAERGAPIMVFVGNPGAIEIHTGPVHRILEIPDWLNVMDPGFNLHLKVSDVAEAWRVEKPTSDGVVTSVELYDAEGVLLTQLFGARKPGVPEREDWRALLAETL